MTGQDAGEKVLFRAPVESLELTYNPDSLGPEGKRREQLGSSPK